ncbi:MAG: dimethyl sulfone monooxygenase SfnG [Chitinophagales bacterium]|nr:dimethyl sulfone monooxygenase SfnG [Chitinophagales bacterium]MCZ2392851.1 dimethyl sulfone monooxygenase SfnG [Chitinophagales bacterium]
MKTEFAYWVPNISGGLAITNWPMKTDWTYQYNKKLAQSAEQVGFKYGLAQARFIGSYNANIQLEALSVANALAANTDSLNLIGAIHPGLWHPAAIANFVATSEHISNGRFHLNIVSGWLKDEFTKFGEPWLEHDERYARSEEFIDVLRGLWTEKEFSYNGRFYRIDKAPSEPKPTTQPTLFIGGGSDRALRMAGKSADVIFINGGSLEKIKGIVEKVREYAQLYGRKPPKVGVNGFVIARDTEQEAKQELENIISNASKDSVEAFKQSVRQAGKSSPEGYGMWSDSDFNDLIQYNDGFKTGLIGTQEQVVERIRQLDAIGVDIILAGFLHYSEDLARFGNDIISAVKQIEPIKKEAEIIV